MRKETRMMVEYVWPDLDETCESAEQAHAAAEATRKRAAKARWWYNRYTVAIVTTVLGLFVLSVIVGFVYSSLLSFVCVLGVVALVYKRGGYAIAESRGYRWLVNGEVCARECVFRFRFRGFLNHALLFAVVTISAIVISVNVRTNVLGSEIAYDKEAGQFVDFGWKGWLPSSQYTILDMNLECANPFRSRLDVDDDKLIEYEAYGYLKASISEEVWKRYVAAKIGAGDGRVKFVFCDILMGELFINFGQPFKREVSADEVNAGAAKFFEEQGLNADVKLDVVSIEHFVKN